MCQGLGENGGFVKPSLFLPRYLVFLAYALVKLKLCFPTTDLKLRFKSVVAYGFFREGVWGMTLFSPEKRVSPKKKKRKSMWLF